MPPLDQFTLRQRLDRARLLLVFSPNSLTLGLAAWKKPCPMWTWSRCGLNAWVKKPPPRLSRGIGRERYWSSQQAQEKTLL